MNNKKQILHQSTVTKLKQSTLWHLKILIWLIWGIWIKTQMLTFIIHPTQILKFHSQTHQVKACIEKSRNFAPSWWKIFQPKFWLKFLKNFVFSKFWDKTFLNFFEIFQQWADWIILGSSGGGSLPGSEVKQEPTSQMDNKTHIECVVSFKISFLWLRKFILRVRWF